MNLDPPRAPRIQVGDVVETSIFGDQRVIGLETRLDSQYAGEPVIECRVDDGWIADLENGRWVTPEQVRAIRRGGSVVWHA